VLLMIFVFIYFPYDMKAERKSGENSYESCSLPLAWLVREKHFNGNVLWAYRCIWRDEKLRMSFGGEDTLYDVQ
jgi:hypothetical protein